MVDCCGGLLLFRCFMSSDEFCYLVCNPSTEEWVAFPDSGYNPEWQFFTHLGFDPAVSSHFHVFEFVMGDCGFVEGVEIYSSETGLWNFMESEWDPETTVYDRTRTFFNGMLHLVEEGIAILSVDVEGEIWQSIGAPRPELENVEDMFALVSCFIGQSQGKLCYLSAYDTVPWNLSIWVLEDYSKDEWTLKHKLTTEQLSEKINCKCKTDFDKAWYYHVVAVHSECNLIYYIAGGDTLMSYDMGHKQSCVIENLGPGNNSGYLPYVPLYSEILSHGC